MKSNSLYYYEIMTQEQLDKVVAAYEKILKELDNAIEQRDLAKAQDIVDNKLGRFNKKQKGLTNTAILESLNDRVKKKKWLRTSQIQRVI